MNAEELAGWPDQWMDGCVSVVVKTLSRVTGMLGKRSGERKRWSCSQSDYLRTILEPFFLLGHSG